MAKLDHKCFRSTRLLEVGIRGTAVEQVAKTDSPNLITSDVDLVHSQLPRATLDDTGFWTSLLMAAALTSIAIGIVWDISWHETVGHARDWLALSMLGDEAKGAIRDFLKR